MRIAQNRDLVRRGRCREGSHRGARDARSASYAAPSRTNGRLVGGSIPPAPHHPEGLTPKLGAPSSLLSDDAIETASVQVTHSGVAQVELPGIEPGAKGPVTCGKTEFDNAKRRETTRNDLRIHRKVLTASTRAAVPSGWMAIAIDGAIRRPTRRPPPGRSAVGLRLERVSLRRDSSAWTAARPGGRCCSSEVRPAG